VRKVKARELREGMLVSIPADLVAGDQVETRVAGSEYAEVISVNGGMADNFAGPGQVVLYSENFAPIGVDGARELEVAD
jgi:hypothetical protein